MYRHKGNWSGQMIKFVLFFFKKVHNGNWPRTLAATFLLKKMFYIFL